MKRLIKLNQEIEQKWDQNKQRLRTTINFFRNNYKDNMTTGIKGILNVKAKTPTISAIREEPARKEGFEHQFKKYMDLENSNTFHEGHFWRPTIGYNWELGIEQLTLRKVKVTYGRL